MSRPLTSAALAVLAVSPFAAGVAQEQAPPLEPGMRVRVTAAGLGIEKQEANDAG